MPLETTDAAWAPRSLSVVVPVFEEAGNVEPLVGRIVAAARPLGLRLELLFVDDGSRDDTLARLRALLQTTPELVVVALRRNFGQTLALQAGLDLARGDAVVTMDGDLQNDPADIPRLLDALRAGADVASGWRRDRKDQLVLRKVPSKIANGLIRRLTGIPLHDQGCALKAYRSEVVRGLDLYADMHRFIAIFTMPLGATISEVEVRHHARTAGVSKYGLSRTFKVLADLLTLKMLTSFRENPLRWFALLGAPFLTMAAITVFLSMFVTGPGVVLASVTLLTATTFGTCLTLGLLAESVTQASGGRGRPTAVFREWRSEA